MVLIILDGWGERQETKFNAIKLAETPFFDQLMANYPHTLLEASGEAMGLPKGQMGNSEVGHLHIGGGRKVPQDLTRIDLAIADGSFFKNPVLLKAIQLAKNTGKAVHTIGLLSPGGVHSRDQHLMALIKMVAAQGVKKNYLHAILDGRDTPPQSARASIEQVEQLTAEQGGQIASLIGRYYAMDRDKRWDRTEVAYRLLTEGEADQHVSNAIEGLTNAYAKGQTDEFVKPIAIHAANTQPITVESGDVVIFMNFRADRARQLTLALTEEDFQGFPRPVFPKLADFITLTQYQDNLNVEVAFAPLTLNNTLGAYLSQLGYRQLRIAETEKYAHVTYFLNGGVEAAYPGEERLLIASPLVATYDLKPEMSAVEMTNQLIAAIKTKRFDLIVCNFANPDMVGHTGNEMATEQAITVVDQCLQRIITALQSVGGEALITADHGNAELMFDETTKQPHTAHTNNLVPFIYVGRESQFREKPGALDDVAPTLLHLMGLNPPPEMTGQNLITLK